MAGIVTGPEHYREAELLLYRAGCDTAEDAYIEEPSKANTMLLAAAQVHATLALTAATALNDNDGGLPIRDYNAWATAVGTPKDGV